MNVMEQRRILHVVGSLAPGGMESLIMNYYRNMDRNKIQFDFYLTTSENTQCFYEKEILALGGRIYKQPLFAYNILSFFPFNFYSFLRKHKEYQIVHSHRDIISVIYLMIAMIAGKQIRIAHSHNTSHEKNWKMVPKILLKVFSNTFCTHRFACGKKSAEWLFGKNKSKDVQIISNAIDVDKFKFDNFRRHTKRNELGLDKKYIIGHVGRLESQKNHKFLLDIFYNYLLINPDSILLIVGSGSLYKSLINEAIKLGINDNIIFYGATKDVSSLLQAMDIVVFPSFFEGFPVALVEMQCAGLPILASTTIPAEIKMCNNLHFYSLGKSANEWARKIQYIKENSVRIEDPSFLDLAGYNIKKNVMFLQEIYSSLNSGNSEFKSV